MREWEVRRAERLRARLKAREPKPKPPKRKKLPKVVPGLVGDVDWRPIPGFACGTGSVLRYEVTRCGRVRSLTRHGSVRELRVRKFGGVLVCSPGGTLPLHPARAVLWAWGPPLDPKHAMDLIQYVNGTPSDWRLENLRTVSRSGTVDSPECSGGGEPPVRQREGGDVHACTEENRGGHTRGAQSVLRQQVRAGRGAITTRWSRDRKQCLRLQTGR